MHEYDYSKLIGKMREKGYTQEKAAQEIGISPCSLNLSLNNKRNLKQCEILKICETLDIPTALISDYFFTHKL